VRTLNPLEDKLMALIEPVCADLGYRIVRIRLMGLKRKTLQVMAEREEDGLMEITDCERISRTLSALFDEKDPIQGEYALEISSPGIDRPLVREEDFARFIGHEAKLETAALIDGRKRFRGEIAGAFGGQVRLATQDGEVSLPFSALTEARLVLTDKLIEDDLRRAKAAEEAEEKAIKEEKKKRTKPS
jgi:ribosome maturation factor RimP